MNPQTLGTESAEGSKEKEGEKMKSKKESARGGRGKATRVKFFSALSFLGSLKIIQSFREEEEGVHVAGR